MRKDGNEVHRAGEAILSSEEGGEDGTVIARLVEMVTVHYGVCLTVGARHTALPTLSPDRR